MSLRSKRTLRAFVVLTLVLALAACATKPSVTEGQADVDYDLLLTLPGEPLSYEQTIRPILERRS